MNEDGVIDLLRAAGTGGGASDIGPAMRRGAKLRRRRRIGQAVGGGAGLAAVVAMGVFVTGLGDGGKTVVTAAGDPKPAEGASVGETKGAPAWPSTREANIALLLERLGDDFRRGVGDDQGAVVLDPDSATARQLPKGYDVSARLYVEPSDSELSLAHVCKPMVEKGLHVSPCADYKVPDGRTVQIQEQHVVLGEYNPPPPRHALTAAWDATRAMFPRADGSYVRVDFHVSDTRKVTPKADQAVAVEWLQGWTDKIAAIAADPGVRPKAGETTEPQAPIGPTRHEVYQGYLQEALGESFSLIHGKVTLEPGSQKYSELPFTASSVTGELEFIRQSQFDAACGAKPGVEACNWKTLDDGTKVHWRAWADRDSSDNTMRGEFAAYLPREDGNVVMALLTLTGTNSPVAKRDAHREATLTWFESLRHAMIGAATDKRMGADVYTTK